MSLPETITKVYTRDDTQRKDIVEFFNVKCPDYGPDKTGVAVMWYTLVSEENGSDGVRFCTYKKNEPDNYERC